MSSLVEETHEASSSFDKIPRDYISLINPSVEHVHLKKEERYPLFDPLILEGVKLEWDMLGMILSLKYVDYDITNEKKSPELIPSKFLMKFISLETHMVIIEP
jgi:hypothetical protein